MRRDETGREIVGHLLVVERAGGPVWFAKWRDSSGHQVKRRLGRAWLEPLERPTAVESSGAGESWRSQWRSRRGRKPPTALDANGAAQAMGEAIRRHEDERSLARVREEEARKRALDLPTAAREYLDNAEAVGELRRSTLADYRYCMEARILRAPELADKPLVDITPRDVRRWRDRLLREGASPRTANKLRQLLANVYRYAARPDAYGIELDPVGPVEKVREQRPGRINYFTPEDVEALVLVAREGRHRTPPKHPVGDDERRWRALEDEQDAALFTTAAYAGLRKGELLALRWRDVDFSGDTIGVWRSYTSGAEGATKSEEPRSVPMAAQVAAALKRLRKRRRFTRPDDLVFCSRTGEHLDGSALRRRYVAARDAAGLRPLRFHDLRHAFASQASLFFAPHEVQEFMGHADVRTTRRYTHFRPRSDHATRLTQAFAAENGDDATQQKAAV